MAEIEMTLPTVQYGNVKVRATPEELGVDIAEPGSVGMIAAMYTNLFTQGFKRGSAVNVTLDPETAVSAPQGASREAPPGNPQAAAERLADGRLPRTVDEYNEMAKQVIESELGPVTEVPAGDIVSHYVEDDSLFDEAAKPWDQKVAPKPKPWETDHKVGDKVEVAGMTFTKVAEPEW